MRPILRAFGLGATVAGTVLAAYAFVVAGDARHALPDAFAVDPAAARILAAFMEYAWAAVAAGCALALAGLRALRTARAG